MPTSTLISPSKNYVKAFEELTAKEQTLAIRAHTVWYLRAARAHGRKVGLRKSTQKIANQLERMALQLRNL
jgi:hypothetical protein